MPKKERSGVADAVLVVSRTADDSYVGRIIQIGAPLRMAASKRGSRSVRSFVLIKVKYGSSSSEFMSFMDSREEKMLDSQVEQFSASGTSASKRETKVQDRTECVRALQF